MAIDDLPDTHRRSRHRIDDALREPWRLRDDCQIATSWPLLPVDPGNHDLPHDRSSGGHLRADAVRKDAGDGRQPLLNGLTGGADIDMPVELDVDHVQSRRRLAPYRLDAVGTQQRDLDRLRDERLHLLGGQPLAFGDDHHPGTVEIGEHIDRHQGRQPAPVDEQHETR